MKDYQLTIVTPTLNAISFIEKNIKSISSLPIRVEHIIVDGGSTDGTISKVKEIGKENIILLNQNDKKGMYSAIHQGFSAASTPFLAYVNADDVVIPEGFASMYVQIFESTGPTIVYGDSKFHFIDENRKELIKGSSYPRWHLRKGIMPFVQPCAIFRKVDYNKIGGLNFEEFKYAGDLDLYRRLAQIKDMKFINAKVLGAEFLKYGASLGDLNIDKMRAERLKMGLDTKVSLFDMIIKKIIS